MGWLSNLKKSMVPFHLFYCSYKSGQPFLVSDKIKGNNSVFEKEHLKANSSRFGLFKFKKETVTARFTIFLI